MAPLPSLTNVVNTLFSLNVISMFGGYTCVSAPSRGHRTSNSPEQHPVSPSHLANTTVRPATSSDLSAITTILTSAFAGTPAWDYGYQFRAKHPYYHWECLRQQLSAQWDAMNNDTTWVRVMEESGVVVSVAVWRVLDQRSEGYWDDHGSHVDLTSEQTGAVDTDARNINCSLRLDQNVTRVISFNEQLSRLRRPYIEDAYAKQFHLETLATHPKFQGRGYASELVSWGVRQARELGVNVVTVVCEEEEVVEFYKDVGFVELGGMDVGRVDGGVLRFEAMRFGR